MQVLSANDLGFAPTSWNVAVTGDFNGDRKSDLLRRNTTATPRFGSSIGCHPRPTLARCRPAHRFVKMSAEASQAALTERAHWLTVEWLPKYGPEMNDIEIVWGDRVTLRTARGRIRC